MSGKDSCRGTRQAERKEVSKVRSSAAEYLTFVAATGDNETSVEMRYEDENIWLTQKMMATLYDVSVPAINQHLKRIFADNELEESAVIKQYLTTAVDGKNYKVKHYSLQAIIAVGDPKGDRTKKSQATFWLRQLIQEKVAFLVPLLGSELQQGLREKGERKKRTLAKTGDMEGLFGQMGKVLTGIGFLNPQNPEHQMHALRSIFKRAELDEKEVHTLRGVFSQVEWAVGRKEK